MVLDKETAGVTARKAETQERHSDVVWRQHEMFPLPASAHKQSIVWPRMPAWPCGEHWLGIEL